MPLPSEDTTPPVTKIYFAINNVLLTNSACAGKIGESPKSENPIGSIIP
ncbi:hypothetical protein SDC9_165258 [bioreactor metagenome]|uniref:Uncharacterized protein n=1 Tax=bioreactor metagenome TaxID=1076179 RepID=A0A645G140_9ZZZZ